MNCLGELLTTDLTVALILFQSSDCSQNKVIICKTDSKCIYILGLSGRKCDKEQMGSRGRVHVHLFSINKVNFKFLFPKDEASAFYSQWLSACDVF